VYERALVNEHFFYLFFYCRPHQAHTQTFEFCYECQGLECPTILEYVKVQMDLVATSTEIKIAIVSPGKTTSVLMDFVPERVSCMSFLYEFRFCSVNYLTI
jgi:hypothetical protein